MFDNSQESTLFISDSSGQLLILWQPALRDQIYVSFDLLVCLPPSVATSVAEQIVSGVLQLVQNHKEIISSQTEWNVVFALLRSTILHPEAARPAFELITSLVSDGPEQTVTIDNFNGLLNVLDDFASAAGAVAETQHRQGRRHEPLTSAKYVQRFESQNTGLIIITVLLQSSVAERRLILW